MQTYYILGYYDIQSITIINNGSSNGTVCIQCNYITGADSTGCIVSLSNYNTVYYIAINRDDVIGCIDDVIAGLYSIVVYQIQQDGAINKVISLGESALLGYTPWPPIINTPSPLPTGTMYYSTYNDIIVI